MLVLKLTVLSVISSIAFPLQQEITSVKLGDSAMFECTFKREGIFPIWYINETYYSLSTLPGDYEITSSKNGYDLAISNTKLWMNNTQYACSTGDDATFQTIGHLIVQFEFDGPMGTDFSHGSCIIACDASQLDLLSVVWIINGTYYVSSKLPSQYILSAKGLIVTSLTDDLNGTTYQCLVYSEMLWKNYYYSSDEFTLHFGYNTSCDIWPGSESLNFRRYGGQVDHCRGKACLQFKFNEVFFNSSEKIIAWNEAMTCPGAEYSLIKELKDHTIQSVNLRTSTETSIQSSELEYNGGLYHFYITASNGSDICALSQTSLSINREVLTQVMPVVPNTDGICFSRGPPLIALWTTELNVEEDGFCACAIPRNMDFSGCSCPDKNVTYSNGNLCWGNITLARNNTFIYFVKEAYEDDSDMPESNYNYTEAHHIVVAEKPGSPRLILEGFTICFYDVYNGHSEVESYNVSVKDITGYSSGYLLNKTGSPTCATMSSFYQTSYGCGPLNVTITGTNKIGTSPPTSLLILSEREEDRCECIRSNVKVRFNRSSSSNDSYRLDIQLLCMTEYSDIRKILFTLRLVSSKNEIVSKLVMCSDTASFEKLDPETGYVAYANGMISNTTVCLKENYQQSFYMAAKGPNEWRFSHLSILLVSIIAAVSTAAVPLLIIGIKKCRDHLRRGQ